MREVELECCRRRRLRRGRRARFLESRHPWEPEAFLPKKNALTRFGDAVRALEFWTNFF